MNNLGNALKKAGVEHRRTREIRETLAEFKARAATAQARAEASGGIINRAERERRALEKAHAPREAHAPAYGPEHYNNSEPWERLADAVLAAG